MHLGIGNVLKGVNIFHSEITFSEHLDTSTESEAVSCAMIFTTNVMSRPSHMRRAIFGPSSWGMYGP